MRYPNSAAHSWPTAPLVASVGLLLFMTDVSLLSICACVQYEPEIFPGLIYRMKQPKVVLLIFVSGKVVLTGSAPCLLKLSHIDPRGLTEYSLPCQHLLMKNPGSDLKSSAVLDG